MLTVKYIHVTAVLLSFTGFVVRGIWMITSSRLLQYRSVRTIPHFVDTVLLLSGATMVWAYGWSPLRQPWLGAKLIALGFYILLGGAALRASCARCRIAAWVLAMLTFSYIVAVALTKQPLPDPRMLSYSLKW